jgi:hypothetical protein
MRAICQQAFTRNVSSSWLIIVIALLPKLFKKLIQPGEFFGSEMFSLDEAHDEALRRASEEAVDHIADCLANYLASGNGRLIKVGAIPESPFDLTLAMKDVKHGLDSGVSKVTREALLNGLHICSAGLPQNIHDLELETSPVLGFPSIHKRTS